MHSDEKLDLLQLDDGYVEPVHPERRLWYAVILTAITEYEGQLARIRRAWAQHVPVNRYFADVLMTLRYEMNHAWFQRICDIADVPHNGLLRKLYELDLQYELNKVNFTDEATTVTDWYAYKRKERSDA